MLEEAPTPAARFVSAAKSFGGVRALRGVSLDLEPGRVHALVGENGAGKSTLLSVLTGALSDFEGRLEVGGAVARFRSPRDARAAGVVAIHQELALVPTLRVRENLALGEGGALLDVRRERARAREILAPFGLADVADELVEALPVGAQQAIEIARALARDARILVLDEPTSALGPAESRELLVRVRRAAERGAAVVFVSHRLDEVLAVADRVSVLRGGALVASHARGEATAAALVEEITGRALPEPHAEAARGDAAEVLRLDGLTVTSGGSEGLRRVSGLSLAARAGEIVGLFGLRGAGSLEALEGVFGARDLRASGALFVAGRPVPLGAPRAALAAGLALVPSDRKATGLLLDATGLDNAALSVPARGWGLLDRARERAALAPEAARLGLDPAALERPARALSGGNQQKLLLLRALAARPRVLFACEPTRGVDVGAKAELHEALRRAAAEGAAVVVASSEAPEICALAHRALVLVRGRVALEARAPLDAAALLRAAVGAPAEGAA